MPLLKTEQALDHAYYMFLTPVEIEGSYMTDLLYSVVIPVYNSEKYLERCFSSVCKQTYSQFEVILVDDGSTDGSASICDMYATLDAKFHAFHTPNQGQAAARLYGMHRAHGDWILFLDSDDYWCESLLQILNQTIDQANPDMIIFRYEEVDENGRCLATSPRLFNDSTTFTPDTWHDLLLVLSTSTSLNSLCIKAVKAELCRTETGGAISIRMGEDLLQSIPLILSAQKIVYRNAILYRYSIRSGSMMRSFRMNDIVDSEVMMKAQLDTLKETNCDTEEDLKVFWTYVVSQTIQEFRLLARTPLSKEDRNAAYQRLRNRELFRIGLNSASLPDLSRLEKTLLKYICEYRFNWIRFIDRIAQWLKRLKQHLLPSKKSAGQSID